MTRSAPQRGPTPPRWVRGLLAGAFMALSTTGMGGCGLSYVFRNISPLHPTGWSFAWPIFASQSKALEQDMADEERDRVPILDPVPGEFAPPNCLDPPSEAEAWRKVPKFERGSPVFYETQRNNARFLIEKIGDKADPVKIYPLAGRAACTTAITSARSTSTSSTGRTTRSPSTTGPPGSRSSTSTRIT